MKKNLFFLIFLLFTFSLSSIEVEGHLTEDTTWSPENNPYLVIGVLYVDNGITLFIEPGTEIYINAALFNNDTYVQDFAFHGDEEPTAKMFWVNGRIIAEGTEQDSILFTRIQQDSTYFKWGIIHLSEQAELSRFKYCRFEHASTIVINLTFQPSGAIAVQNSVIVDSCYFIDNRYGIQVYYPVVDVKMEVTNNFFTIDEGIDPNTTDWGRAIHVQSYDFLPNRIWIANNEFHNRSCSFGETISIVNNKFYGNGFIINSDILSNYVYDNYFYNVQSSINAHADEDEAGIYIRKNIIEADSACYNCGIKLYDYGYYEVSDNIIHGGIHGQSFSQGKIENNYLYNDNYVGLTGTYDVVQNNIINNCSTNNFLLGGSDIYRNNVIINNVNLCNTISDNAIHENNIYIRNENIFAYTPSVYGNPIFRNCILDFELPEECIDGGGNIWVDSLQAQALFEDIQNGDFHLIEGSLAIDAGFDTLGYYYPFDMDYNHRVWDGDGNRSAIIDIGPYEYNSPSFGGIEGYTYNPTTGDPVDYVLLKINNQPGEFTFSDSLGNFQYKLPAGIYDIYAERVFHEDVIEYEVEVFDGQFTQIAISMTEIVDVEDYEITKSEYLISNLSNFPNPFNPSTRISFSLKNSSNVKLTVYNVKGQKVTMLVDKHFENGSHTVTWNGKDEAGKNVSSGIYFYKISAGKETQVKKMLLLK
ncbi:MAG: T9SS type A sorting domain-containing protein [Candidatus Cloacimonetes bacterium]|nr:T9SS type A sorting domain-containing protein [Candidatus Cloacimonadota bacterium]